MERMRTPRSTRKELRDDMTIGFVGIRISKWETRTVEITDKNKINFKVNGQRLKKYHDGHIDAEDKEVVEFKEDTTPQYCDLAVKKLAKLVKYQSSGILIMEYLVKISKKARILELKRTHLKITVLTSNTPYPSRKIRRIYACTLQKTMKETRSIRRIQVRPIRRIQDIECEYSGRYRTWSLHQETPNTPYQSLLICRIDHIPDLINTKPKNGFSVC
ncbi:hypothetical protein Tco_1271500 [Tanacetum coccineum]